MIMNEACPNCGSEDVTCEDQKKNEGTCDSVIREFVYVCSDCGEHFIMSEVLSVTSRLVAKDYNELEKLIDAEEKENRRR